MKSKKLSAIAGQGELPLVRAATGEPVADEVIFRQPNFSAAIRLAVNVSELEEKEIYLPLGIDAGHWTRIMKADAHFPVDKLNDFCDLVRNEIPLVWWARCRGKGLHMLQTEAERLLEAEREKNEKLAIENKVLRDVCQGRS